MWKREELLVTSNFSFSFVVFKKLLLQTRKNKGLFEKELKAFADDKLKVFQIMIFAFDGVENIVRKGENAGYQHFLLFPQCL